MSKGFYDSKVYQFYLQEQQEIDKLKWIESKKQGRDIGKIQAVFLWTKHHRQNWIKGLDNS